MSTMTKRIDGILAEEENTQYLAAVAAETRYLQILQRSAWDESTEAEAQEVLHLAKLIDKTIDQVRADAKAFVEAKKYEQFLSARKKLNDTDILDKLRNSQTVRDRMRKELEAIEAEVTELLWELSKRSRELSDAQQSLLQLRRKNFKLFGLRSPEDADFRVNIVSPVRQVAGSSK